MNNTQNCVDNSTFVEKRQCSSFGRDVRGRWGVAGNPRGHLPAKWRLIVARWMQRRSKNTTFSSRRVTTAIQLICGLYSLPPHYKYTTFAVVGPCVLFLTPSRLKLKLADKFFTVTLIWFMHISSRALNNIFIRVWKMSIKLTTEWYLFTA